MHRMPLARDIRRFTIYHSPQSPGYTCWCGLWKMPGAGVMLSFTQAIGPLVHRPLAPPEVRESLSWPPAGHGDEYDMTGLDLRNVHLRSDDAGLTWDMVSADPFRSCMNGVTGEAEVGLPDGRLLRGLWGPYLPYDHVPRTGLLQRSTDGSLSWSEPEAVFGGDRFRFWPKRIRALGRGEVLAAGGLIRADSVEAPRDVWARGMEQALFVSRDAGVTWSGPIPVLPERLRERYAGEELDVCELDGGDLLAVIRADAREPDGASVRLQARLARSGATWEPVTASAAPFPPSGHPELLRTREGLILHVATTGISATADEGGSWLDLGIEGIPYYPRAVQTADGRILCVGHVGGDDGYGRVDQSIVGLCFPLDYPATSKGTVRPRSR